jgi:hypothetical protein
MLRMPGSTGDPLHLMKTRRESRAPSAGGLALDRAKPSEAKPLSYAPVSDNGRSTKPGFVLCSLGTCGA